VNAAQATDVAAAVQAQGLEQWTIGTVTAATGGERVHIG